MTKFFFWILAAAVLIPFPALAAETAPDKDVWNSSISFSSSLTRGNSETFVANIGFKAEKKGGIHEILLGVDGNYGENEVIREDGTEVTETNLQNARAYAAYRLVFCERNYFSVNGEIGHDRIADIDYRLLLGPGLGRYLIKTERSVLSVEVGVSYIKDKVVDIEDDRIAYRAAQKFDLKLSDTAKIWESAEYLPTADQTDQYLINAEAGIEAALSSRFSLRLSLIDKYNSEPAVGLDENDLILTAGIVFIL